MRLPGCRGSGTEEQAPGKPCAEFTAEEDDENTAERQVTEQMQPVRVQGEGGDEPPPLAVEYLGGVGVAEGDPVERVMAGQGGIELGDVVEGGEEDKDRKGRQGVFRQRLCGRCGRGPVAVFRFEETQLIPGRSKALSRHQQTPAGSAWLDAAGEIAGLQDERPELRPSFG